MKAILHFYFFQTIVTERGCVAALGVDPMICRPYVNATVSGYEFSSKYRSLANGYAFSQRATYHIFGEYMLNIFIVEFTLNAANMWKNKR